MNAPKKYIDKIWNLFVEARSGDIVSQIEGILYIQKDSFIFLENLRKAFFCYICDFDNHKFIDIQEKEVHLSNSSCAFIA